MTDYTVPFRPMPAQSIETPTETPAEIHAGFLNAVKQVAGLIDQAPTLNEAIRLWKQCRQLEVAIAGLSNHAAEKAESFDKEM